MPTHTWTNLDQEKRDRIITVAIDTFAQFPFAQASLSGMVKTLGIAKGSIYQYFADKEDCYLTVVLIAHERILVALRERIPATLIADSDVFAVLRRYCAESVRVAIDFPAETALLRRAEHEGGALAERVRALSAHIIRSFITELLQSSRAQQRLRRDIDPEAMAFVLQAILSQVTGYITQHLAATDDADESQVRAAAQRIVQFFDAVMSVLEQGLAHPGRAGGGHA